jgi:hypothetical protein
MVTKGYILHSGTTVNFNSGMNASQIQEQIDLMPKRLGGNSLTFNFDTGTYTLEDGLIFSDFHGGSLHILGDQSDNAATIVKGSVLGFAPSGQSYLSLDNLHCKTYVSALAISGATTGSAVSVRNCSPVTVEGCLSVMGTGSGYGVRYEKSYGDIKHNYIVSGQYGIYNEGGHIHVHNNNSSGDATGQLGSGNPYPWYGMWSDKGGIISKQSSSLHPSGITGEGNGNAGVFWN